MNLAETHALLTYAAAVDNRRFDDATVIAWQEILADVPFADARAAVRQHFATSTAYLLPAHVRTGAEAVAAERQPKPLPAPHEVRALPGRFELDDIRDQRVRRGVAACVAAFSLNGRRR